MTPRDVIAQALFGMDVGLSSSACTDVILTALAADGYALCRAVDCTTFDGRTVVVWEPLP